METQELNNNNQYRCIYAILSCLFLSITYVASLYVWSSPHTREHSSTIKKRFFSVFIMALISPVFLYFGMSNKVLEKVTIWELLGLKWSGLLQAIFIPLILTMILFLGPLCLQGLNGQWKLYFEPMYWIGNARTLIWWRNLVVAPLSEEWTFRACMLPLLLQCFSPTAAIFICPLFFGVAHFHHVVERTKVGMELKSAVILSSTLSICIYHDIWSVCSFFICQNRFIIYSFIRTKFFNKSFTVSTFFPGHFVAPFAAHSFCNHMGFPDLTEVLAYNNFLKRAGFFSLFVIGLVAWCFLLTPLTNPTWFNNNLFWDKNFLQLIT
ncbi:Similar to Sras: CAAX prenyl protease 2 (Drosophila melanogaster) [Cotesia congregata]|uniref:CAAX prenyl protease 2 n=1 Tax=Cotesia congregata TaxID=51543 RepID=A0A8J2HML4_COTCN|nr:Similar to Sras: CAAX prenyl protease 2 (Drosophila melanogaster) [Cotesia congregata]